MIKAKTYSIRVVIAIVICLFSLGKSHGQACDAGFIWMEVDTSNQILFLDTTTGTTIDRTWFYGDGQVELGASDSAYYQYINEDEYQVCLAITQTNPACVDTVCRIVAICEDCIWPGDANDDGIADMQDVLSIGLAFGGQGTPRQDQSIDWTKHYTSSWQAQIGVLSVNQRHADSDGSGFVDATDVEAVNQNYGRQHQKNSGVSGGSPCISSTYPPLRFSFREDSVEVGDSVIVDIFLGEVGNLAQGVHGLAFGVEYPGNLVQDSMIQAELSNSAITEGGGQIELSKNNYGATRVDVGISRIDQQGITISPDSAVASLIIVMDDHLDVKDADLIFTTGLVLHFSNVILIDQDGLPVNFCSYSDSIYAYQVINDTPPVTKPKLDVYPNPAHEYITFRMPEQIGNTLHVFDATGRRIHETQIEQTKTTIDIRSWPSGMYMAKISDEDHYTHKFFISH